MKVNIIDVRFAPLGQVSLGQALIKADEPRFFPPCGNPSCDGSCGTCQDLLETLRNEGPTMAEIFADAKDNDGVCCAATCRTCDDHRCTGHPTQAGHTCGCPTCVEYLEYLNDPTYVTEPRR